LRIEEPIRYLITRNFSAPLFFTSSMLLFALPFGTAFALETIEYNTAKDYNQWLKERAEQGKQLIVQWSGGLAKQPRNGIAQFARGQAGDCLGHIFADFGRTLAGLPDFAPVFIASALKCREDALHAPLLHWIARRNVQVTEL
jgi:hypothetical protein